jgi:GTPase-associated protein 1, N-terminal domain type 1/Effector-associated domain 1
LAIPLGFIVHQALFGQAPSHGQGYEMLATSHPDKALVRQMGNSTDLGELTPNQVRWEPALRGRAWENFYLLFKTYADTSADVRPGRVFSHAFIIEQQHLALLSELSPLLDRLPTAPDKNTVPLPIELKAFSARPPKLTPRLGYLLKELIRPTRSGPVLWAGQAEFEEAANLLWHTLAPQERQLLTLNLGFMPNQLRDTENLLQLVAVPEAMLDRWRNDFFIIAPEASHTILSEAEAYAAGDTAKAQNLDRLIKDIGGPRHITDLDTLQRITPTVANLSHASLQEVLAVAVTLHWYRPAKPDLGRHVIGRFLQLVQESKADELARLGSLAEGQLGSNETAQLAIALRTRVVKLSSTLTAQDLVVLLTAWKDEPRRSWWRKSLREALQTIFDQWNESAVKLVVELLGQPAAAVADYFKQLPATQQVEQALVTYLPTHSSKTVWENGSKLAKARNWYRLHMVCVLAQGDLLAALQQQLAIDKNPEHISALSLAAERAQSEEFVASAVTLAEPRLIGLAGSLCAQQPALLQPMNVDQESWQAVWLVSIHAGGTLWAGTRHPENRVTSLLNQLLAGNSVAEELLTLISSSEYADLRANPNRHSIWKVLPSRVKNDFLAATAMGLLVHAQPENTSQQLEPELTAIFSSPAFATKALSTNGMTLTRVIAYAERFSIGEGLLLSYLRTHRGAIHSTTAGALGQLVQQKQWRSAAQTLFDMAWLNPVFKDALTPCVSLLGPLNKLKTYFLLGLSSTPSKHALRDNWWQSLLAEVRNVYFEGPRHGNLWEESGGENHVLKTGRSGGDQWADALKKLRGHQVKNTTRDLLAQLVHRHPHNETFRILQQSLSHA